MPWKLKTALLSYVIEQAVDFPEPGGGAGYPELSGADISSGRCGIRVETPKDRRITANLKKPKLAAACIESILKK